eukprot:jgi/Mesvir1/15256/Mv26317-RA.1
MQGASQRNVNECMQVPATSLKVQNHDVRSVVGGVLIKPRRPHPQTGCSRGGETYGPDHGEHQRQEDRVQVQVPILTSWPPMRMTGRGSHPGLPTATTLRSALWEQEVAGQTVGVAVPVRHRKVTGRQLGQMGGP